jgi:putative protease
MLVDGRPRPLGDARYSLSPGDLSALSLIPEIVHIGIAGLKIEGRYKDENYVALTTLAYRKAVDEAWAGHAGKPDPNEQKDLEQVFARARPRGRNLKLNLQERSSEPQPYPSRRHCVAHS